MALTSRGRGWALLTLVLLAHGCQVAQSAALAKDKVKDPFHDRKAQLRRALAKPTQVLRGIYQDINKAELLLSCVFLATYIWLRVDDQRFTHRVFYVDDPTLNFPDIHYSYKYHKTQDGDASTSALAVLVTVVATLMLRFTPYGFQTKTILSMVHGLVVSMVVTELLKGWTGKQRPLFLRVCKPTGCVVGQPCDLTHCSGNKRDVAYASKSFPSDYASLTFFFASCIHILLKYAYEKDDLFSRPALATLYMIPYVTAFAGSIHKVTSYDIHFEDLFAGAIIGSFFAHRTFGAHITETPPRFTDICGEANSLPPFSQEPEPEYTEKTVLLMRHGWSLWNEAQHHSMFEIVDSLKTKTRSPGNNTLAPLVDAALHKRGLAEALMLCARLFRPEEDYEPPEWAQDAACDCYNLAKRITPEVEEYTANNLDLLNEPLRRDAPADPIDSNSESGEYLETDNEWSDESVAGTKAQPEGLRARVTSVIQNRARTMFRRNTASKKAPTALSVLRGDHEEQTQYIVSPLVRAMDTLYMALRPMMNRADGPPDTMLSVDIQELGTFDGSISDARRYDREYAAKLEESGLEPQSGPAGWSFEKLKQTHSFQEKQYESAGILEDLEAVKRWYQTLKVHPAETVAQCVADPPKRLEHRETCDVWRWQKPILSQRYAKYDCVGNRRRNVGVYRRMQQRFNEMIVNTPASKPYIVAAGHSLFFARWVRDQSDHPSCKAFGKLVQLNGAVWKVRFRYNANKPRDKPVVKCELAYGWFKKSEMANTMLAEQFKHIRDYGLADLAKLTFSNQIPLVNYAKACPSLRAASPPQEDLEEQHESAWLDDMQELSDFDSIREAVLLSGADDPDAMHDEL